MPTEILRPDSAGDATALSPSNVPNWATVDEAVADDDSTYVETSGTTTAVDYYGLQATAVAATDIIDSIDVIHRRRRVSSISGSIQSQAGLRLAGADTNGTAQTGTSTSYVNFEDLALARPGGGSWAPSDLNTLQVKLALARTSTHDVRTTQVYVEVNYTARSIHQAAAAFAAGAEVAPTGQRRLGGVTALAAQGLLSPANRLRVGGAAAQPAIASLAGAGAIRSQNSAVLAASAALAPNPWVKAARASFAAQATMGAHARGRFRGMTSLSGASDIEPFSQVTLAAAASFAGQGSFAFVVGFKRYGSRSFAGTASFGPITATYHHRAIASYAGAGLFRPAGSMLLNSVQHDKTHGRAWALVYDVDDTTLVGILPFVQPARTIRAVNQIGFFELTVPELHTYTNLIQYGRYVRVYYEGAGLRFRGIIEDWENAPSRDGVLLRRVWGRSLAAEASYESTYHGIKLQNVAASAGFTTILSRLPAWTATTTGTYQTQSGRYNLRTLFEAAVQYSERAMGYVRETWTPRQLELKNSYSDSGMVIGNVGAHSIVPSENASIAPIKETPHIRTSGDVFNRVVPYGRALANETFTLQRSTRTTPYTIHSMRENAPGIVDVQYYKGTVENGEGGTVKDDVGNATFNLGEIETAGDNRAVVVFIRLGEYGTQTQTPDIGNITVGGRPAREVVTPRIIPTPGAAAIEDGIFAFVAVGVPRGTVAIGGVKSINAGLDIIAVSLEDVDQVSPVIAESSASGTASSVTRSLTLDNTYERLLGFVVSKEEAGGVASINFTAGTEIINTTAINSEQYAVATKTGVTGSQAIAANFASSSGYGIALLRINPSRTFYIEDAASIAAKGGIPRVKILADVEITGGDPNNEVNLANQLYDKARYFLETHTNPREFYRTIPEHLPNDQVLPGDSFRFLFAGLVEDESGRRLWKQVDNTQILLAIEENLEENRRSWRLLHSTVLDTSGPGQDRFIVEGINDLRTLQLSTAASG